MVQVYSVTSVHTNIVPPYGDSGNSAQYIYPNDLPPAYGQYTREESSIIDNNRGFFDAKTIIVISVSAIALSCTAVIGAAIVGAPILAGVAFTSAFAVTASIVSIISIKIFDHFFGDGVLGSFLKFSGSVTGILTGIAAAGALTAAGLPISFGAGLAVVALSSIILVCAAGIITR